MQMKHLQDSAGWINCTYYKTLQWQYFSGKQNRAKMQNNNCEINDMRQKDFLIGSCNQCISPFVLWPSEVWVPWIWIILWDHIEEIKQEYLTAFIIRMARSCCMVTVTFVCFSLVKVTVSWGEGVVHIGHNTDLAALQYFGCALCIWCCVLCRELCNPVQLQTMCITNSRSVESQELMWLWQIGIRILLLCSQVLFIAFPFCWLEWSSEPISNPDLKVKDRKETLSIRKLDEPSGSENGIQSFISSRKKKTLVKHPRETSFMSYLWAHTDIQADSGALGGACLSESCKETRLNQLWRKHSPVLKDLNICKYSALCRTPSCLSTSALYSLSNFQEFNWR